MATAVTHRHGRVVLFGGVNSTFFFDSTWTWG